MVGISSPTKTMFNVSVFLGETTVEANLKMTCSHDIIQISDNKHKTGQNILLSLVLDFQIDLATLRHQRAESSASNSTTSSPKKSPPESPTRHLSPSTSKDAKSSPSRSSTSGSTRSSSRPSSAKSEIYAKVRKSSVASGGRPSSGRPENKRKHSSGEAAVSKPDGDDEANKGEKDKETDNDPEETNKLHEITCLSLPPLPAGTQKTNTQTDSHTAAPPSAEQVRRNSLLGSLPPLEPVGLETDLTADINVVLGTSFHFNPQFDQLPKRGISKNGNSVYSVKKQQHVGEFWQKVSHSIDDYKNVKTPHNAFL